MRGPLFMSRRGSFAAAACLLLLATSFAGAESSVSRPGGAGHALLFRDQVLVKTDFKDFPTTELTFEAWISSSDFCHAGTIISYAKDSKSSDPDQRIADFNHFVIFDPRNLAACHDFKYIDLKPDPQEQSCYASYRSTVNFVERDGTWHHLAVTWTAANKGETNIYMDGLLMATAFTQKTSPLEPGGAFMLGGEQDCYGGCTDPKQGFYGIMDEVRVWRVARKQEDIMRGMRWASGLENHKDLVAYWKFNEPDADDGIFRQHHHAKDSSGKGNDLSLESVPRRLDVTVKRDGGSQSLKTGALEFKNNVAANRNMKNMPKQSFSVEFWAKGRGLDSAGKIEGQQMYSQFISFATQRTQQKGGDSTMFMDDAIRVERYLDDLSGKLESGVNTAGSISVHINSNENTDSSTNENWIDFDARWTDDHWHHVAVTWDWGSGETKLYLDGEPKTPFWKSESGFVQDRSPEDGGVPSSLAAKSSREGAGSLALGQDQDCFGGCFSPSNSFDGQLAALRIWDRVVSQDEVKRNMWRDKPDTDNGLVSLYVFDKDSYKKQDTGVRFVSDRASSGNDLMLKGNPPEFVYSTAPLTATDGTPVMAPQPGSAGYSLSLHDRQVLILPNFQDFPSDAITVEFWMLSVDTCRPGVPFSYAHGRYEKDDNAFLIFNYNAFGISVMEDEGTMADHLSGVAATDGKWHHIAVTWESSSGWATLYDNGRAVWRVKRSQGKKIPPGGTLVVGREQDCEGGCFDSAKGAAGKSSEVQDQEYGPQDFFGTIEQMRVWKVVRTPEQIKAGMDADDGRGPGGFANPGVSPDEKDLVAYWKFDEGKGYIVKDATNHGHDLLIAEKPTWEVVRWLSSCGNGAVEGLEECDDGDPNDGNGCSSTCKVEPGWECSGSPSVCRKKGDPTPTPGPTPSPSPGPTPSPQPSDDKGGGGRSGGDTPTPGGQPQGGGGGGGSSRSAVGGIIAAVVVSSVLVVLGGVVYAYRYAIYEQFPQVEAGMGALAARLGHVLPGKQQYNRLSIDPEELDLSPEFVSATPARSAPGHQGRYEPIPDSSQRQNGQP